MLDDEDDLQLLYLTRLVQENTEPLLDEEPDHDEVRQRAEKRSN